MSKKRPRGSEIWQRCSDGALVRVTARRTDRPHGDIVWSTVVWMDHPDERFFGVWHESDFTETYRFLGKAASSA